MLGNYLAYNETFGQRVDFVMTQDEDNFINSYTYLTEDSLEKTFYVQYTYHSINQPVTINPPEDAENYIQN